jgi:hypothetical protein
MKKVKSNQHVHQHEATSTRHESRFTLCHLEKKNRLNARQQQDLKCNKMHKILRIVLSVLDCLNQKCYWQKF